MSNKNQTRTTRRFQSMSSCFKGNALLHTGHLSYFQPIETPRQVCHNHGILFEDIVINPFTSIVNVSGIAAVSQFPSRYKYKKPYRVWSLNQKGVECFRSVHPNIQDKFVSLELGAGGRMCWYPTIKAEKIDKVIDSQFTLLQHEHFSEVRRNSPYPSTNTRVIDVVNYTQQNYPIAASRDVRIPFFKTIDTLYRFENGVKTNVDVRPNAIYRKDDHQGCFYFKLCDTIADVKPDSYYHEDLFFFKYSYSFVPRQDNLITFFDQLEEGVLWQDVPNVELSSDVITDVGYLSDPNYIKPSEKIAAVFTSEEPNRWNKETVFSPIILLPTIGGTRLEDGSELNMAKFLKDNNHIYQNNTDNLRLIRHTPELDSVPIFIKNYPLPYKWYMSWVCNQTITHELDNDFPEHYSVYYRPTEQLDLKDYPRSDITPPEFENSFFKNNEDMYGDYRSTSVYVAKNNDPILHYLSVGTPNGTKQEVTHEQMIGIVDKYKNADYTIRRNPLLLGIGTNNENVKSIFHVKDFDPVAQFHFLYSMVTGFNIAIGLSTLKPYPANKGTNMTETYRYVSKDTMRKMDGYKGIASFEPYNYEPYNIPEDEWCRKLLGMMLIHLFATKTKIYADGNLVRQYESDIFRMQYQLNPDDDLDEELPPESQRLIKANNLLDIPLMQKIMDPNTPNYFDPYHKQLPHLCQEIFGKSHPFDVFRFGNKTLMETTRNDNPHNIYAYFHKCATEHTDARIRIEYHVEFCRTQDWSYEITIPAEELINYA